MNGDEGGRPASERLTEALLDRITHQGKRLA